MQSRDGGESEVSSKNKAKDLVMFYIMPWSDYSTGTRRAYTTGLTMTSVQRYRGSIHARDHILFVSPQLAEGAMLNIQYGGVVV